MDGTIQVESQPGVGSTFIFDVLLGVSDQSATIVYMPTKVLQGMKVLVVDENERDRNVMVAYLRAFSFDVSTAIHGKEALRVVQQAEVSGKPFKLVCMDYRMPKMDGITVAIKMGQELALIKPPAIMMVTTHDDEAVINQAVYEAHVDGFLFKPIRQPLLYDTILKIFGYTMGDQAAQNCSATAIENVQTALAGTTILLVEDNELNQQVARELLKQAKVEVLLAKNGQEAVDMVTKHNLDGVLMDIQMPVMDGLTACREIRKEPRFAQLPILAMTANAMSGDREICLSAGMQDHIAKPIDLTEMFAKLMKWIQPVTRQPRSTAGQEVATGQPKPEEKRPEKLANMATLPVIPGINTQAGLKRMGSNVSGYQELLGKFRSNQGSSTADIQNSLAEQDWSTARRLAHTLKGVAGTIGAEILQERARVLESAIIEETDLDQIEALLQQTAEELVTICAQLDQALPQEPHKAEPQIVTEESQTAIEQRNTLLRTVFQQLSIFDTAVEQTLSTLQQNPGSKELHGWLKEIEQHVSLYDYEGAVTTLQKCADAIHVTLEKTG